MSNECEECGEHYVDCECSMKDEGIKRSLVQMQNNLNRARSLLFCLVHSMENKEIFDLVDRPYWDLMFVIQEIIDDTVEEIKKL